MPPLAAFGLLVWVCAISSWLAIRQDAHLARGAFDRGRVPGPDPHVDAKRQPRAVVLVLRAAQRGHPRHRVVQGVARPESPGLRVHVRHRHACGASRAIGPRIFATTEPFLVAVLSVLRRHRGALCAAPIGRGSQLRRRRHRLRHAAGRGRLAERARARHRVRDGRRARSRCRRCISCWRASCTRAGARTCGCWSRASSRSACCSPRSRSRSRWMRSGCLSGLASPLRLPGLPVPGRWLSAGVTPDGSRWSSAAVVEKRACWAASRAGAGTLDHHPLQDGDVSRHGDFDGRLGGRILVRARGRLDHDPRIGDEGRLGTRPITRGRRLLRFREPLIEAIALCLGPVRGAGRQIGHLGPDPCLVQRATGTCRERRPGQDAEREDAGQHRGEGTAPGPAGRLVQLDLFGTLGREGRGRRAGRVEGGVRLHQRGTPMPGGHHGHPHPRRGRDGRRQVVLGVRLAAGVRRCGLRRRSGRACGHPSRDPWTCR